MKRECHKYKRWVEKKGNKDKSETVLDFANQRKPSRDQDHLFVGNGKRVPVKAIGSTSLSVLSA
ncbi:unnamed protein product [Prunus armeniaca]